MAIFDRRSMRKFFFFNVFCLIETCYLLTQKILKRKLRLHHIFPTPYRTISTKKTTPMKRDCIKKKKIIIGIYLLFLLVGLNFVVWFLIDVCIWSFGMVCFDSYIESAVAAISFSNFYFN